MCLFCLKLSRVFSVFLCFVLLFSLVPAAAAPPGIMPLSFFTLNDMTWAQINDIATNDIARNHLTEAQVMNKYGWGIGSTKTVIYNGQEKVVRIIGINHDNATGGGKIGLTFGFTSIIGSYIMHNFRDTSGGWHGSQMRNIHIGGNGNNEGSVYTQLPFDLRAVMTYADKYTNCGGSTWMHSIVTSSDRLSLMSRIEATGSNTSTLPGEGTRYAFFTGNTDYFPGVNMWLRSPAITSSNENYHLYMAGQAGGSSLTNFANSAGNGVAPIFYIGKTPPIIPLTPSISFSGVTGKVYDGNVNITGTQPTIVLSGTVGADAPVALASFTFSNANAGINKTVNATNIQLPAEWINTYSLTTTTLNNVASSLSISPRPVTITPVSGQGRVYGQDVTGITYSASESLIAGNAFTGALSYGTATDAGSYPITMGSLDVAGGNYSLSLNPATVNYTITPAAVAPYTLNYSIKYADPREHTYSVSTLISSYRYPSDVLTYSLVDSNGRVSFDIDGSTGVLKYAFENAGAESSWLIGDISTAKISISGFRNYNPITVTVIAEIINRTPVEISGITVDSKTYDGEPVEKKGTAVVRLEDSKAVVSDYVTPLVYLYTNIYSGTVCPDAPVNAGSYYMTVYSKRDDPEYKGESAPVHFTVSQAPVTITAGDITGVVKRPVPEFTYTIEGLLNEDELKTAPLFATDPFLDLNTAGSYMIKPYGAAVPDTGDYLPSESGSNLLHNYSPDIIYVHGTLILKPVDAPEGSDANDNGDGSVTVTLPCGCTVTVSSGSTVSCACDEDRGVTVILPDEKTIEVPDGSEVREGEDGSVEVTLPGGGTVIVPDGSIITDNGDGSATVILPCGCEITVPYGSTVKCRCDEGGGVAVTLPDEKTIEVPEGSAVREGEDGSVEVTLPGGDTITVPGGSKVLDNENGSVTILFPCGCEITVPYGSTVQCRCDEDGGIDVNLPDGVYIEVPDGSKVSMCQEDDHADVELPCGEELCVPDGTSVSCGCKSDDELDDGGDDDTGDDDNDPGSGEDSESSDTGSGGGEDSEDGDIDSGSSDDSESSDTGSGSGDDSEDENTGSDGEDSKEENNGSDADDLNGDSSGGDSTDNGGPEETGTDGGGSGNGSSVGSGNNGNSSSGNGSSVIGNGSAGSGSAGTNSNSDNNPGNNPGNGSGQPAQNTPGDSTGEKSIDSGSTGTINPQLNQNESSSAASAGTGGAQRASNQSSRVYYINNAGGGLNPGTDVDPGKNNDGIQRNENTPGSINKSTSGDEPWNEAVYGTISESGSNEGSSVDISAVSNNPAVHLTGGSDQQTPLSLGALLAALTGIPAWLVLGILLLCTGIGLTVYIMMRVVKQKKDCVRTEREEESFDEVITATQTLAEIIKTYSNTDFSQQIRFINREQARTLNEQLTH